IVEILAVDARVSVPLPAVAVPGAGLHAEGVRAARRLEAPLDADGAVGARVGVAAPDGAISTGLREVTEAVGVDRALRAARAVVADLGRTSAHDHEESPPKKPEKPHDGGE